MKLPFGVPALIPAAVLVAVFVGGLAWDNSGRVPAELSFAKPVVDSLTADGIRPLRVIHGSHYEGHRRERAASIQTRLGYLVVLQFNNGEDAEAGAREAQRWCCRQALVTQKGNQVFITWEPDLDRFAKRFATISG